jgi:hypothetical protein
MSEFELDRDVPTFETVRGGYSVTDDLRLLLEQDSQPLTGEMERKARADLKVPANTPLTRTFTQSDGVWYVIYAAEVPGERGPEIAKLPPGSVIIPMPPMHPTAGDDEFTS